MLYLALGDYENAILDYDKAIKLDPNVSDYYRQRALGHLLNSSLEMTKSDLEKAREMDEAVINEQNERGLSFFSEGNYQKAISNFTHFIEANSDSVIGYQNRGAAYYQAGLFNEAIEDFSQAIGIDPNKADLYQMRAISFLAFPKYHEKAKEDLLVAAQLNPMDANVYRNLAATYFLLGFQDKAIDCFNKAFQLSSPEDHAELYKNLAVIYFEQGDFENALISGQKAIELGNADPFLHLINGGGALIGNRYYTEHALARIAPKQNIQVLAQLEARAIRKAREYGVEVKTWEDVEKWTKTPGPGKSFSADPRGIPPMIVEAEIANPGSTGFRVILNEAGDVVTVVHLE